MPFCQCFSSSPRRGCYYCSGFVPRGLSSAVFFFPAAGLLLLFRFCSARAKLCRYPTTLPRDVSAALRLLNMTEERMCHSERSRGISWKRTRRLILNTFSFNAKKRLRATRIAVLLTYKQHYKAETRRM